MYFGIVNLQIRKLLLPLLGLVIVSLSGISCAQTTSQADLSSDTTVKKHQERAVKLQEQQDWAGAAREQEEIVALAPEDAGQYVVLSGLYLRLDNLEKAENVIKKAIELEPADVEAHEIYARILEKKGDKQGVVRERAETVRLEPKELSNLVNLGVAQKLANDNLSARKSFQDALKANPDYIYAIFHLALLEADESNYQAAVELLERVAAFKPSEDEDQTFIESARRRLTELKDKLKTQRLPGQKVQSSK